MTEETSTGCYSSSECDAMLQRPVYFLIRKEKIENQFRGKVDQSITAPNFCPQPSTCLVVEDNPKFKVGNCGISRLECPPGQVLRGVECWDQPPPGYDWTTPGGLLIGRVCPPGTNDSGTTCWYNRGSRGAALVSGKWRCRVPGYSDRQGLICYRDKPADRQDFTCRLNTCDISKIVQPGNRRGIAKPSMQESSIQGYCGDGKKSGSSGDGRCERCSCSACSIDNYREYMCLCPVAGTDYMNKNSIGKDIGTNVRRYYDQVQGKDEQDTYIVYQINYTADDFVTANDIYDFKNKFIDTIPEYFKSNPLTNEDQTNIYDHNLQYFDCLVQYLCCRGPLPQDPKELEESLGSDLCKDYVSRCLNTSNGESHCARLENHCNTSTSTPTSEACRSYCLPKKGVEVKCSQAWNTFCRRDEEFTNPSCLKYFQNSYEDNQQMNSEVRSLLQEKCGSLVMENIDPNDPNSELVLRKELDPVLENVCGCYLPQQEYDRFFNDLTTKNPGLSGLVNNPQCSYPLCINSDLPMESDQSCPLNYVSCISNVNITGRDISSSDINADQVQQCSLNQDGSSKNSRQLPKRRSKKPLVEEEEGEEELLAFSEEGPRHLSKREEKDIAISPIVWIGIGVGVFFLSIVIIIILLRISKKLSSSSSSSPK